MDKIRIGNDIHIEWLIFRNNQPEVFEGKDVEVRLMHTRTRDVMPLDWVISEGVVSATFYGKDQIDTGDYKLMLVENNGAPNMATIDECKAFTLVQYSCQEQKEEPSTSLQLHKVQLTSSFALSGGGNINVEGYPNVDELEEVKELSGNENIIITDTEGNKKTTIGNLKEYVVKDISELPPFRIFGTESDYNAVKDELGDCVVCLRDTGVMLYHVYSKAEDGEEGGGEIEDKYIRFADPEVQRICAENWGDGAGITEAQVKSVTILGTQFAENLDVEIFNEFEEFSNLTTFNGSPSVIGGFCRCKNLKSIKLPKSLTTMYDGIVNQYYNTGAFKECESLTEIVIPPLVTRIPQSCFHLCNSLETVTLEGKVVTFAGASFAGCESLLGINGTDFVETIEGSVFSGDTNLQSVSFPSLVSDLKENTFYNCTSLRRVESLGVADKSILNGSNGGYGNMGVFHSCSSLEFVDLSSIISIGAHAFSGCTSLEDIGSFNERLTTIGNSTFYNCSNLKVSNIPDSIESLDNSAFYNCSSLEIEDLALPNLTSLGQNAFYGVKIKKISNLGKLTSLPAASTYTQNFGDKSVLEEVVLPIGITNIGVYAFMNYTLLTGDFNLLSVTTIGGSAFQNTAITSIMLPLVNTISWNAFTHCKKLKFVKIGDSIGKIDAAAFQNCISLENVIIENATPPTLSGTSFTNTNNCLIYVPDASVEAYKTATNWSTYASRIKGISELPIDNPTLYDEIKDYLGGEL